MKRKAKDLEFISIINSDGLGVSRVSQGTLKCLVDNSFCKDEKYNVFSLSATEGTFIAIGLNTFVVKLKKIK